MSVKINQAICNGCPDCEESRCVKVCPGNLLYRTADNETAIRDRADCWGCAACVKECPRQAISMYLPVEIGGRGSTLTVKDNGDKMVWILKQIDGTVQRVSVEKCLGFNSNL
ncbi:MAG: 4Fe-4S dicluster domain-containing protein [Bacillota bacterium]